MNLKTIVEQIHKSDKYGVIYEMGAGVGISHTLMSYAGASNTIRSSHSLYSKKSFIEHFRIFNVEGATTIPRAVSKEYCDLLFQHSKASLERENINFILASSFQIPDKPGHSKHGWIGLFTENSKKFYHLSFPADMSRKGVINEAAKTGLNILNAYNKHCRFESYIDFVDTETGIDWDLTLEAYTSSSSSNKLTVLQPTQEGSNWGYIGRIEPFLRDKDSLMVYKGSFNPWHHGHSHVLDRTEEILPSDTVNHFISLSVNTYGKGEMTKSELSSRLNRLKEVGKPIILISRPYFDDLASLVLDKVKGTLYLAMGDDVMDKIIEMNDSHLFSHKKISGLVVKRHSEKKTNYNQVPGVQYIDSNPIDISSTEIRNLTY